MVNAALDECAPITNFISRPGYIAGLTAETKSTMKMRDNARSDLKSAKGEKWILLTKHKKLRNKATNLIRRDTVNANGKRIEEAKDENEIWRIVNDITKPKSSESIKLNSNGSLISNEELITT